MQMEDGTRKETLRSIFLPPSLKAFSFFFFFQQHHRGVAAFDAIVSSGKLWCVPEEALSSAENAPM